MLLEKANAEIQRIIAYLKENEDVWNKTRTLKLYKALRYSYTDMEKDFPLSYSEDNAFESFCEDNYDTFKNDEFDLNLMRYIGRTSSFYITDLHDKNIVYVLCNVLDIIGYCFQDGLDMDGTNLIMRNDYTEEDIEDDLNYLINNAYNDVVNYLKPAIALAEHIDNFRKNQIEHFKEWLEFNEEKLQEEFSQRKAENERYNSIINSMIKKAKDIFNDTEMAILKGMLANSN